MVNSSIAFKGHALEFAGLEKLVSHATGPMNVPTVALPPLGPQHEWNKWSSSATQSYHQASARPSPPKSTSAATTLIPYRPVAEISICLPNLIISRSLWALIMNSFVSSSVILAARANYRVNSVLILEARFSVVDAW